SFWSASINQDVSNNCFKMNGTALTGTDEPKYYLTDNNNSSLTLNIFPYLCDGTLPEEIYVQDLGNEISDSIPSAGGQGGGMSSEFIISSPKIMYDSIHAQLRHRNYSSVKN